MCRVQMVPRRCLFVCLLCLSHSYIGLLDDDNGWQVSGLQRKTGEVFFSCLRVSISRSPWRISMTQIRLMTSWWSCAECHPAFCMRGMLAFLYLELEIMDRYTKYYSLFHKRSYWHKVTEIGTIEILIPGLYYKFCE